MSQLSARKMFSALMLGGFLLVSPNLARTASAATFTTICKFTFSSCAATNAGYQPWTGVIMDSVGNLYGTTNLGGANGDGTVFEINVAGNYTDIYDFCSSAGCADGHAPTASLILDVNGNLYGTTSAGGSGNHGTAFELTPPSSGTKWTYVSLHVFCSSTGCADGEEPMAGLSYKPSALSPYYDGVSPLYGAAKFGGANGDGAVFELSGSGLGTETILHSFASGADGERPIGGVTLDSAGNIFGTTSVGGAAVLGGGTIFEITSASAYSILYNFCTTSSGSLCTDGRGPTAKLALDSSGNIFGTTAGGSTDTTKPSPGLGTVFEFPAGSSAVSILYSFCSGSTTCPDGSQPTSGDSLVLNGNKIFGVTTAGGAGVGAGASTGGTVYRLSGAAFANHTILHSFCKTTNCTSSPPDGSAPLAGLYQDAAGNLFGTTSDGGHLTKGTVFEWSP